MPNYKNLRLKNICSTEFRHLFLLLFWVFYLLSFFILERIVFKEYISVYSHLDDIIPFCEFFIIPYVFWYFYLVIIHLYTLKYDVDSFKKLMYFLILSFGIATVVFSAFPNIQHLRPTEFTRNNIFTDIVKFLYVIDTNTNVCPSLHVVGSLAVLFTAWNTKGLNRPLYRALFLTVAVLIILSTVFLKQHSVVDIFAGILLSVAVYPFAFIIPDKLKRKAM